MALLLATLGLAACGGGNENTAPTAQSDSSAEPAESGEEILIKAHVIFNFPPEGAITSTGKVLDGSTIGDSPFCPGGTFEDQDAVDPSIGTVDRTLTCPDGTLRIGFDPGLPVEGRHIGSWKIVSGTGPYEGWQGSGEMEFEDGPVEDDDEGSETFTGTVSRAGG